MQSRSSKIFAGWWGRGEEQLTCTDWVLTTCKKHFLWIISLILTILGDRYNYFLHFGNDKTPREFINNLLELTTWISGNLIYLINLVCLIPKSMLLSTTFYVCLNHKLFSNAWSYLNVKTRGFNTDGTLYFTTTFKILRNSKELENMKPCYTPEAIKQLIKTGILPTQHLSRKMSIKPN